MRFLWFSAFLLSLLFFVSFMAQNNFGVSEITTYSGPQVLGEANVRYVGSGDPFIDAINQTRAANGVSILAASDRLNRVSELRLSDMITQDYYSHFSPDGYKFSDFLPTSVGYSCENLNLTANSDPKLSISDWLSSPKGHKECLLNPNVNYIGYDFGVYDLQTSSYIAVLIMSTN